MTRKLDHRYGPGVNGQGQIHLKSVLRLVMRTLLSFFDGECSYLAHCMLLVTTMVSDHQLECDRGQGQIYLKSISWLLTPTPLAIWGCSYIITIAYGVKITTKASDHHYDLGVKGQVQLYVFCLKDRNTKSPDIFWLRVFIFGTLITCGK